MTCTILVIKTQNGTILTGVYLWNSDFLWGGGRGGGEKGGIWNVGGNKWMRKGRPEGSSLVVRTVFS